MSDVGPFFRKLKYHVVGTNWATGWRQLNDALHKEGSDRYRVTKAAYLAHGWTHIIDPELVIFTEEEALSKESQLLNTKIVVWLSESASDTYGFWVYEHGRLLRGVLTPNGKPEGKGRRLSAEKKSTGKKLARMKSSLWLTA